MCYLYYASFFGNGKFSVFSCGAPAALQQDHGGPCCLPALAGALGPALAPAPSWASLRGPGREDRRLRQREARTMERIGSSCRPPSGPHVAPACCVPDSGTFSAGPRWALGPLAIKRGHRASCALCALCLLSPLCGFSPFVLLWFSPLSGHAVYITFLKMDL